MLAFDEIIIIVEEAPGPPEWIGVVIAIASVLALGFFVGVLIYTDRGYSRMSKERQDMFDDTQRMLDECQRRLKRYKS
jgi:hypothetical protein